MPRLTKTLPTYRKHKQSGQAIVTLSGRDYLLGPHGTKASTFEYDRLIGEWLQHGRQLQPNVSKTAITVVELIVAYLEFAKSYYRKNGQTTGEYAAIVCALRHVKALYGRKSVAEFGPTAFQVVVQRMIDDGLSRGVVNQNSGRIKRMFRWGVSRELVPAEVAQTLWAVAGLRKGRTTARETGRVLPVADAVVKATIAHLPDVPADMVRLQLLFGCRPYELVIMRPMDIDRSVDPWCYRPSSHKTEHHDRERVIFAGPQAQAIISRYLARDAAAFCFRPCDSEEKRRAAQHAARRTPLSCGNVPGSNRVRHKRHRAPGGRYRVDSYRRAIHRACEAAAVPQWSPNQLRHSAATEIRRRFGLEAAQVTLGHSKADVTQVYAERDYALAARVAKEVG